MLKAAVAPLLRWARTSGRLIVASAVTATGFNSGMADPYVAIIVGAETYRDRFKQARLEPVVQSVSIAGSGSLLSSIIPWNVHGAFVGGVLGIGVLSFAGYAIVVWATPLVLLVAAMLRYRNDVIPAGEDAEEVYGEPPSEPPPDARRSRCVARGVNGSPWMSEDLQRSGEPRPSACQNLPK